MTNRSYCTLAEVVCERMPSRRPRRAKFMRNRVAVRVAFIPVTGGSGNRTDSFLRGSTT